MDQRRIGIGGLLAMLLVGCHASSINEPHSASSAPVQSVTAPACPEPAAPAQPVPAGRAEHPIAAHEVDAMKAKGLTDPIAQLLESLIADTEVIPAEATVGGTMGFYDHSNIRVLNERWVYATFEDGHRGGYGIFEYTLTADGAIQWRSVTAQLL